METQSKKSTTAKGTAICRTLAHLEHSNGDELARFFLPPFVAQLLRWSAFRRYVKRRVLTPGVYEYVIARTAHMDGLFATSLEENWPQIVLLGAGYDSRASRFAEQIQQTVIYEVDAPATQAYKTRCIEKAGLQWPAQTVFVPLDVNRGIEAVLTTAGYDSGKKTLFIMEGLTMYLPEQTVMTLLEFAKQNRAAGTTLAFDYFFESVVQGRSNAYGAKEQYAAVKKVGEPFMFGLEKAQMADLIQGCGFTILDHFDPETFERTYLNGEDGLPMGKMYRCAGNMVATVGRERSQKTRETRA